MLNTNVQQLRNTYSASNFIGEDIIDIRTVKMFNLFSQLKLIIHSSPCVHVSAILSSQSLSGGQQVLSHLPLQGKPGPGGSITTTLTPQQLVQLQQPFQIQQVRQCYHASINEASQQPFQIQQ